MNSDTLNAGYNHFQSLTLAADTTDEKVSEARPAQKFITETRNEPIFINPLPVQQDGFIWQTAALLLALCILALMKIARKNFVRNLSAAFSQNPYLSSFCATVSFFRPEVFCSYSWL